MSNSGGSKKKAPKSKAKPSTEPTGLGLLQSLLDLGPTTPSTKESER